MNIKSAVTAGRLKFFLFLCILLYPLDGIFQGIDITDSGFHALNFSMLFQYPDKIGFSTYLTTFLGWLWLQAFGFMGYMGLKLFNVLVLWLTLYIYYRLLKGRIDDVCLLAGLFFALVASTMFIPVVSYNQMSALFFTFSLYFLLGGIWNEKVAPVFVCGVFLGLNIFVRFPNITGLVFIAVVWYWALINGKTLKWTAVNTLCFFAGVAGGVCACLGLLLATGQFKYYARGLAGLLAMTKTSSSNYSAKRLIFRFILENANAVLFAAAVLAALAVIILLYNRYQEKRQGRIIELSAILVIYAALAWLFEIKLIFVLVGLLGIAQLAVVLFNMKKDKASREMSLLAFSGLILLVITPMGSNTGISHSRFGMWIGLPLLISYAFAIAKKDRIITLPRLKKTLSISKKAIRRPVSVLLCIAALVNIFVALSLNTWESADKLHMTYTVSHPLMRGTFTTKTKADSLNGVLAALGEKSGEDDTMIVYGSAQILYWLKDIKPYLSTPWPVVDYYTADNMSKDLLEGENSGEPLPKIVVCKTDLYKDGFNPRYYNKAYSEYSNYLKRNNAYKVLSDFMQKHNYLKQWEDNYFAVYITK